MKYATGIKHNERRHGRGRKEVDMSKKKNLDVLSQQCIQECVLLMKWRENI